MKQIENYVRRRYAPMFLCDVDGSSSDDGCMQKLGEQIGKGAFGTVYKALNLANGDTVAIKSVSLQNIPESDLESIMVCIVGVRACKVRARGRVYRGAPALDCHCQPSVLQMEIDMLKTLEHDNIVRYINYIRSALPARTWPLPLSALLRTI